MLLDNNGKHYLNQAATVDNHNGIYIIIIYHFILFIASHTPPSSIRILVVKCSTLLNIRSVQRTITIFTKLLHSLTLDFSSRIPPSSPAPPFNIGSWHNSFYKHTFIIWETLYFALFLIKCYSFYKTLFFL